MGNNFFQNFRNQTQKGYGPIVIAFQHVARLINWNYSAQF